jgi:hypothetical protein
MRFLIACEKALLFCAALHTDKDLFTCVAQRMGNRIQCDDRKCSQPFAKSQRGLCGKSRDKSHSVEAALPVPERMRQKLCYFMPAGSTAPSRSYFRMRKKTVFGCSRLQREITKLLPLIALSNLIWCGLRRRVGIHYLRFLCEFSCVATNKKL